MKWKEEVKEGDKKKIRRRKRKKKMREDKSSHHWSPWEKIINRKISPEKKCMLFKASLVDQIKRKTEDS